MNHSHFTRRQFQCYIITVFSLNLSSTTGTAHHLRTLTLCQLNGMHRSTNRDGIKRKAVSHFNGSAWPAHNRGTDSQAFRAEDVPLLTISIVNQSDIRAAVRIVFNKRHFTRHAELVTFKIDNTILPLMTPTAAAHTDSPTGTATGLRTTAAAQSLFRALFVQFRIIKALM